MADDFNNIDTNYAQVYQQYSQPPPTFLPPSIVTGDVNIVTTVNGATGPITFSSPDGFSFTGGVGGNVVMAVSSPAVARAALGAAASGVNVDISQLNGASQVDVSGAYKVNGTQVVQEQGAVVANPVGGSVIDVEARAQLTELLNRIRAHGLIST